MKKVLKFWWILLLVGVVVFFAILLSGASDADRQFREAEVQACQKAGLDRPVRQTCGAHGVECFYCADAKGRLFPVEDPLETH